MKEEMGNNIPKLGHVEHKKYTMTVDEARAAVAGLQQMLVSDPSDEAWDKLEKFQEELTAFADHLRATYPDHESRSFFHALAGSGMRENADINHEDFQGEDSVQKFVTNFIQKYS